MECRWTHHHRLRHSGRYPKTPGTADVIPGGSLPLPLLPTQTPCSAPLSMAAAARAARRLLSSRLHTTTRHLHASASEGATREASRSFIHPAAVVHPDAAIGQGVSIGPFCTVGPSARIGDACQIHAGCHVTGDTELGEGCVVLTGAILGADIPGRTIIGENNVIGHHAVVGVKCQDLKYKEMNAFCVLVAIMRSESTAPFIVLLNLVIGDNNLIMGSCHIAHDCKIGNNNIFANNTLFAGHIVVEDCTHTAGAVVVHQFCHIGSYSFLGGGSVVAQDVPRYMMVAGDRAELRGLNLEGLRRNGFSNQEVRRLRKAYQKVFMPTSTNQSSFEDRLAELEREIQHSESPAVSCMVESIRMSFDQGRRGICKFRSWNSS
ncbi:probable acyl-[acyl-carrier-protein]--UDP-N-acetylglucosamine O-acyltransferase, mitochondrial isoform X3 [Phragmites australis]|uniref:probable acyl-[acyl-carrier-protein]--UDP-N-acetylglucosamine O-acyltransferase, mitochondrial isoform X3 n=1 Tax=Phragmites australis TaxID=29695 RepID=UPI002D774897|nr:probable acyl-[acyl-carrier-protein]--UDP-N-acetylglucosamine O-acyltransferase, mitochondrial isoform X3 [Phragmites australis]